MLVSFLTIDSFCENFRKIESLNDIKLKRNHFLCVLKINYYLCFLIDNR